MSDQPCAGCPWLRSNQTPEAIANAPTDGRGVPWYDHANLKEKWEFVASGGMMPCHATDKHADLYGGRHTNTQAGRICVGLTILATREILLYMQRGMDFARYKRVAGVRLTLKGFALWAAALNFRGASLEIGDRVCVIPTIEDDAQVTVPWKDHIHNKERT